MPLPMHLSIRGFPRVVMLSARQVVLLTQGRLALCAGRFLYLNPSCLIVTVRLHGAATAVRVETRHRLLRPSARAVGRGCVWGALQSADFSMGDERCSG